MKKKNIPKARDADASRAPFIVIGSWWHTGGQRFGTLREWWSRQDGGIGVGGGGDGTDLNDIDSDFSKSFGHTLNKSRDQC
jgi:hypothetical protein